MRTHAQFCVFMILALLLTIVVGCGGGTGGSTPVQSTSYTVGGTVSGLTGTGLVLQDNGGNNLTLSASGSFTFSNSIASGAAYNVTVLSQPTGQNCAVTNGSGTANANVTNVQVSCVSLFNIGGIVSGLTGTGLVLQDNGGNNLTLSANGSFTFSNSIASGATYSVTVLSQPTGQNCTVTNGSGTANANVTNVQVSCSNVTYTIGGTISGLSGTGLVIQDNGGNNQALSANGSFTFSASVAGGAAYSVTVLTQPTGQSCTVTNGSGTASANVTNVQIVCSNVTYTIGGTISGLSGTGLVIQDNGGNNQALSANGTFTFSNPVAKGSTYIVTVLSQPSGQTCTVTNGSGITTSNVTNVQVTCANITFTIGGSVSGLTGTGLVVQDNGANNLTVNANGTFTFSTSVSSGGTYNVTILTQPLSQNCTVTNGSGTATSNVTNVQVACVGEWTWMGGSSTIGKAGVYGTLGMPASSNNPGGRDYAMSWSDASGNLWLFAGEGFDSTGTGGTLNDLWKFSPVLGATGEWTWIGGSKLAGEPGVYGTLGTAASTNIPGERYGSLTWSDASGNLWLFGGSGLGSGGPTGFLNDLWIFSPNLGTYGEWTWMGGSSVVGKSGVYGTLGTASSTNLPGGRYGAVSWRDALGNLWLFGGVGLDSTTTGGELNDLWKFNPKLGVNGEWTWMGGSNTVGTNGTNDSGQAGVYGTLGTAAPTNVPGGRHGAVSWTDASGNFWLFGGDGYDSTGKAGELNDLWVFNANLGTNGEWTWMSGSNTVGKAGVYGTSGIAASTNIPGGRDSAVSWSDASGNLWLFGGEGYDSTGTGGWYLNDLWKFDPALGATGQWTWMGGSNIVGILGQPGQYGSLGVAASTNVPGGRYGAVSWSDASGNFWLFGGIEYDDLWKYQP